MDEQKKLLPPSADAQVCEPPDDVKYTDDAIENRRRFVQESMIRGISAVAIAKQMGVHRNTIVNDIREIRKENAKKVREADVLEEIGEAVQFFEQVSKDAMFEVTDNAHPMAKVSFLSIAMKAKEDKIKLLTQVGVIPSAPKAEQKATSVLFGDVDLENMQVDELKQLRDKVLSEMYSMKAAEAKEMKEAVVEVQAIAEPKKADANNCGDADGK
jgi:predicted DNA-binding protein (UPF0251 family)